MFEAKHPTNGLLFSRKWSINKIKKRVCNETERSLHHEKNSIHSLIALSGIINLINLQLACTSEQVIS